MERNMNRSKIEYTNEKVPWYYAWNPCGFGCSRGCPYCWARGIIERFKGNFTCEKCRVFEPHLHPERLDEPAKEKKPGVVLVDFTGEIFEFMGDYRNENARQTFAAACAAPWHDYVFLTHQPWWLRSVHPQANWHMGVSVTGVSGWKSLLGMAPEYHVWLSLEPFQYAPDFSGVDWCSGVIIGSEQQERLPCDLYAVDIVIGQCKAAKIPVYVKHLPKGAPKWMLELKDLPWSMPKGTK